MPTYEYLCDNCGNIDEERRMIKDRESAGKCSKCKSGTKRVISIPVLNGFDKLGRSK